MQTASVCRLDPKLTLREELHMNAGSELNAGEHRSMQHLHRSANDRVIAGVCGGIAEYLSIDPSLVRIAFVVGTLWGIGLLLYIALAVILPVESYTAAPTSFSTERTHAFAGTVLVVLGALLLAGNMGWAPWLSWNLFWPGVLILIGIGFLLRSPRGTTFG
jgi:phage shock protein C